GRATGEGKSYFAINIGGGHITVLAGNLHVAVAAEHAHITAAGRDNHGCIARYADVHVGGNRVVAGALRICVQGDGVVAGGDLRFGAGIDLVCFSLAVGVDSFVCNYADLPIVRDG